MGKKVVLIITTIFMVLSAQADNNPDFSCDPNADCSRWWGNDPICEVAKTTCRGFICGKLNDDANRYQNEFLAQIRVVDNSLQDNTANITHNESLIKDNLKLVDQQKSQCVDIDNLRADILSGHSMQVEFITALDGLIDSKISLVSIIGRLTESKAPTINMSEIEGKIDSNKTYSTELKLILKGFVKTSVNLNFDLKKIIKEYKNQSLVSFEKVLNQTSVNLLNNCENQVADIESQGDRIDAQKESFIAQRNKLIANRKQLESAIQEQEARKCH